MKKMMIPVLTLLGFTSLTSPGVTLRFDLNVSDFSGFSETAQYTLEVEEWDAPVVDNTGTPITEWSFPVTSGSVNLAGETTVFSTAELSGSVFQASFDGFGSLDLSNGILPFPGVTIGGMSLTGGNVSVFNETFSEGISTIPVERNSNDLRYLDANWFPDNRGTFLHLIEDSSGLVQENLLVEISNVSIPEPSAPLLLAF